MQPMSRQQVVGEKYTNVFDLVDSASQSAVKETQNIFSYLDGVAMLHLFTEHYFSLIDSKSRHVSEPDHNHTQSMGEFCSTISPVLIGC